MKTLTLSEAFAQATQGPFVADQNYIETDKQCVARCHVLIAKSSAASIRAGQQSANVNAALLAHCFNHMQEAEEALRLMIEPYDENERRECWQVKQAVETLAKLNTVKIP